MLLKSVTLRGFKSFADATTLHFEPGISVIVGPNGSGKSNIVDAVSWVLGSASPKSLRGSAMADVIFAGAAGRPGLGHAAVELTLDNADGLLPVAFAEVSVSRSMFADGETTYAINDVPCRLLDVQELLADAGLGRERHTIVGQGQLDAVLNARPEDRRLLIEEAAGILKHRRRKERALRKLTQVTEHLERIADVQRELRRSLRPLERQAEAAARHERLTAALREAQATLALRELDGLARQAAREQLAAADASARLSALVGRRDELRTRESDLEEALAASGPVGRAAADIHLRLSTLVERYAGLQDRIQERWSGLQRDSEEVVVGRDPAALRAQADALAERIRRCQQTVDTAGARLAGAADAAQRAEQERRAHAQQSAAQARRRAHERELRLRWESELAGLRGALAQAAGEQVRLAGLLAVREQAATAAQAAARDLAGREARLRSRVAELTAAAEAAAAELSEVAAALDEAVAHERSADSEHVRLQARAEALRDRLPPVAVTQELPGVIGPLLDHVTVPAGFERPTEAMLDTLAGALLVADHACALALLELAAERGWAGLQVVVAEPVDQRPPPDLDGARPLRDGVVVRTPAGPRALPALDDVYQTEDLTAASRLARARPGRVFVTASGHVVGRGVYRCGGDGDGPVRAASAAEQAGRGLAGAADRLRARRQSLEHARASHGRARTQAQRAEEQLRDAQTALAECTRRRSEADRQVAGAAREQQVVAAQLAELDSHRQRERERLDALQARQPSLPADTDSADVAADRLDEAVAAAAEAQVAARLEHAAARQELDQLRARHDELRVEARDLEQALAARRRARDARAAAARRCAELAQTNARALACARACLRRAQAHRDTVETQRADQQRDLADLRAQSRELEQLWAAQNSAESEVQRRRQRLESGLDAVRNRLRTQLGLDPEAALEAARGDGRLEGGPDVDAGLVRRRDDLARKVALLGEVNPLARGEYERLAERQRFLDAQVADLRASRRDLLRVVEAVEQRVCELFADAFADVAAAFEGMFDRLFPGGRGRLVLTDPTDLLSTGVEVEARPPGKRVKQLSLLSGGERSLAALATLFAIFAARPSPFYVLDEVEAALDDVNLQRFLAVVRDFASGSQLLLVTHQQRTMEIADTIHGVSLSGSGVSKVVSQRLRDPVPAGA